MLQKWMKLRSTSASTCSTWVEYFSKKQKKSNGREREFFTWLKRCDERSNSASAVSRIVKNVSLLVIYCSEKFLGAPSILKSINKITMIYLAVPTFCSPLVTEKVVPRTIWTVFHYKLKWLTV